MIRSNPQPQWWKGNLHTHTFWSDGNDFPEMVAEWYLDHGYNFLALSDHNILSQGQKWVSLEKADQSSNGDAYPKYLKRFGHHWVETRGSREEDHQLLVEVWMVFEDSVQLGVSPVSLFVN